MSLGEHDCATSSIADCAHPAHSGPCWPAANDWLVIPGVRAGSVTAKTTRSGLVRMFGRTNVKEADVGVGDEIGPGTIVFGDNANSTFEVEWTDPAKETQIYSLHFCPDVAATHCKWHTMQGITKGTSLKTLERLNAGSFLFLGFGWDFEGTVMSWNKGRMEQIAKGCLGLKLAVPQGKGYPDEFSGDRQISSSNIAMQTLNPVVALMSVSFTCFPSGTRP